MPMKTFGLWAIAIAALVVVGGVAGYVFLYQGDVAVSVKDAPTLGSWSHVYVTFSAVDIHESGKDNATWSEPFSGKATVDLATLTNVSQLLGSAHLSPGHYEQVRLTVTNVTGVFAGVTVYLTVVNGTAKIAEQFDVVSGKTTAITVDVDLTQSIHGKLAAGFTFTPVFGATASPPH
ncbi:MAG TPA: DUF4382 domain-containing protein [Thermoplasmata archaeon]|nr:DUF4382 domain-containing protein [Thermoplasmata archaeon]